MRKRKEYFPHAFGSRVDTATMQWLEQIADTSRMSLSAYVRKLIEEHARQDLQSSREVQVDDRLRVGSDESV